MTNKLIIPTILTATILIAGMFAFMPVEKAATVHTTIDTNTKAATVDMIRVVSAACTAADVAASCDVNVTVVANTPFQVLGYRLAAGGTFTGTEVIASGGLVIRGFLSDLDPADTATNSFDGLHATGGIGGAAGTITDDIAHTIGTGADTGDETVTVELVFLLPADATTPTIAFD